eukprot:CAMPEP_0177442522 /NCGR_PEP_ID=MMETSP0369-20130122/4982_1 /TAXON_ID=447022 ORGANISM="Scrippsiella hangoei-like, Strain SHHI-4" /NCGR_SAMPLE_ID=MMETSP0369 /ASSEMBLY_ACC=CAM_ASM_000364 /LENGTH=115 /DNA_ID=CAMNT_0018914459 /DNA_START=232 /DNA_END=576 /DNA_ORIENTATION=-
MLVVAKQARGDQATRQLSNQRGSTSEGVDDETLLVRKLSGPLDAAGGEGAAREVGDRGVRFQEREAASAEGALRQQAVRQRILTVAEIAALKRTSAGNDTMQPIFETHLTKFALL